jgi:hypothetical protein
MIDEQTRRRESHAMIVAIVLLAFAVFSWGVRYKLSLYNPAAHMSAAKLLSQRERPATVEATELSTDPVVNHGPIALLAFAMGVVLAGFWSERPAILTRDVWHLSRLPKQPSQTFFFFRPPPFLFPSR